MKPRNLSIHPNAVVWRVSQGTPMGERMDTSSTSAARRPKLQLPEVSYGSWVTSSFDLLNGSDMQEISDTIPGELFDELFVAPSTASKLPKTPDR